MEHIFSAKSIIIESIYMTCTEKKEQIIFCFSFRKFMMSRFFFSAALALGSLMQLQLLRKLWIVVLSISLPIEALLYALISI